MSDLDIMLDMLARANIAFERVEIEVANQCGSAGTVLREPGYVVLTIERGYSGFVSDVIFDQAGSLKSIEAFE